MRILHVSDCNRIHPGRNMPEIQRRGTLRPETNAVLFVPFTNTAAVTCLLQVGRSMNQNYEMTSDFKWHSLIEQKLKQSKYLNVSTN